MRKLLLALPLASLLFASGCSCAFKDDCDSCTADAAPVALIADAGTSGATGIVSASANIKPGDVLSMEEYEKLVAEGKVTHLPSGEGVVAAAPKSEPIVVAETRVEPVVVAVKEEARPAPAPAVAAPVARRAPASTGVRTIPAMALPKGWTYIHEEDLVGGKLSPEADQQFYSQADRDEQADS